MNIFHPLSEPRQFVIIERDAGNPSLLKAFISLALAAIFLGFATTFAVFPLFNSTSFSGTIVPGGLEGTLFNAIFLFCLFILFQLLEFLACKLLKGKGGIAEHFYFASTLSLISVPAAVLLSIVGLLVGAAFKLASSPSEMFPFLSGSWPLFAACAAQISTFPVLGFSMKVPIWAFDAYVAFSEPAFLALLLAPLLFLLALSFSHLRGISEIHGFSSFRALLAFFLSSAILLLLQFFLFTVSYSFMVMR